LREKFTKGSFAFDEFDEFLHFSSLLGENALFIDDGQALADADAGRTRPARELLNELRQERTFSLPLSPTARGNEGEGANAEVNSRLAAGVDSR
jgi:hypothetical protein